VDGAGREPGTGGLTPEGESGRAGREVEAQAEASRTVSEGTGRMGARKGVHLERKTRQVEVRRKPSFNDNGDAEAGLRGRFHSGARRKPDAGGSRREGGFAGMRIESPAVHRPLGVGSRKRRGPQGRSSLRRHKPKADCRSAGVITSARARRSSWRKPAATEGQRHARGPLQNEGAQARAEAPERGRPEGWPEGMAGDEGCEPSVKRRSRKAAGGLSGGEGRKL